MKAIIRRILCVASVLCARTLVDAQERLPTEQLEFFENRIRPVLVQHCYQCHSAESEKLKGALRLDLREMTLRGGDSGPALVAGNPDESLLIQAVRYESLEMPPKGRLPDQAIDDLVKWVKMGAPDPRTGQAPTLKPATPENGADHWAFQPIKSSDPPPVRDSSWPLSDIDFFVLNRLEREGFAPAKDADRYTWLRRVSFDLTGLPPTVDEIRDFLADQTPNAHRRVVDRLLASRAFGQRWARHWQDLVGYADQIGTSNNIFAEHAWRYRDYLVDVFNDDKPFDRFIREQIAGDLLEYDTVEERANGITATGFLVLGDLEIVEADKAKMNVDIVDQQLVKTSKAFLGMTVGCARCHDHKFDPILQRDYYAIAGFFHSTASVYKTDRGVWSDLLAVELPETESQKVERADRSQRHAERIAELKDERAKAEQRKGEFDALLKNDSGNAELTKQRDQLAGRIGELNREIEHAEYFAPKVPRVYGVREVAQPSNMRITIRGNPRALGDEVPRGFLQVVSTELPRIPLAESGRKHLADWIANSDNPLTARVAVNRIWQKLFGAGLVGSIDYFGVRGETPSHPELLDRLATRFMRDGWSQKRLIQSLVLSRTYGMSSDHNPEAHARDPDNRLLWRMSRRRLDAESLRDGLLAVSGQLKPSLGGPALPLEFHENVQNIDPTNVNPPSFSLKKWRPDHPIQRTIYLPVIRSAAQPGPAELRNVFDFTQPAEFSGQRAVTAVPTQALFLLNSPVVKNHARDLAERVENEAKDNSVRLDFLWLCTLNRPITDREQQDAVAFLDGAGEEGWVELCHALVASNEFLMRL